jgi:hypothetical protein
MAAHANGGRSRGALSPGRVFSIEPQLRAPEGSLYMRYEEVVAH